MKEILKHQSGQSIRALIIDDEPPARRRLTRMLEEIGGVEIVGQARTSTEVAPSIDLESDVDVVFLDINMPGENGVAFARRLGGATLVVFVTAYAEHAVEAFGISAVDYLLKPIEPSRLAISVQRIKERISGFGSSKDENVPTAMPSWREGQIGLSIRGGVRLVDYSDVVVILAQDDYTEVALADGSSELVGVTMKTWEERLPSELFVRVHRSAIICKERLRRLERSGSRWL
ncbi:MAG: LytR/AlgR family response regulator transcription factor, partial [Bradymonadia bacterium]